MGEITDDKYVVYKKAEMKDAVLKAGPEMRKFRLPERIEDAVVIRRQDLFAVGALHTYCNTILSVVETMREMGVEPPLQLTEIADYFHGQAVRAEKQASRKIPD